MRYLFIFLFFLLFACDTPEEHIYEHTIDITYFDASTEIITYKSNDERPFLYIGNKNGCLMGDVQICGIRKWKYKSTLKVK